MSFIALHVPEKETILICANNIDVDKEKLI